MGHAAVSHLYPWLPASGNDVDLQTLLTPQLKAQSTFQAEAIVLSSIVARMVPHSLSLARRAQQTEHQVDGFHSSHLQRRLCTYLPQLGERALCSAASGA